MDNVKHPDHYCKGGIECIAAIKAAVSNINDPYEAYCTGNIIKYAWRWSDKNGTEDLNKLIQYAEFIKEHREDCAAIVYCDGCGKTTTTDEIHKQTGGTKKWTSYSDGNGGPQQHYCPDCRGGICS